MRRAEGRGEEGVGMVETLEDDEPGGLTEGGGGEPMGGVMADALPAAAARE